MLVLLTALLPAVTALTLAILRITRPKFRFAWLMAFGGALLSMILVFLWQVQMPIGLTFLPWQPASLFFESISFMADRLSWPYAVSLTVLPLAILLTASVGEDFPNLLAWAVSLVLCSLGLLAVTANNPLTLVLVWAALDLAELITMLRSVNDAEASERAVIAFAARVFGIGFLVWAEIVSVGSGQTLDFGSIPAQAGLFLVAAAGLRLGVFPLHLPYHSESSLRRGIGTSLRLVTAASSLVLLARIPTSSLSSPLTVLLLASALAAALYGGWSWLRAPDELAGRPYWIIGIAGLSVTTALRGNPIGATAWGVGLVLAGGALFLGSVQDRWLNRALLVGAWALSGLPFSLTASAWEDPGGGSYLILPFFTAAQALILAGYIRHSLRPATRPSLESQPAWARSVYPVGIGLILLIQLVFGIWGWNGAWRIGSWPVGLAASFLTLGLLWALPRFPILNPEPAHWVKPSSASRLDRFYRGLWDLYRWFSRVSQTISNALEGDGGIMWTLLFLVLFISLLTQRQP